MAVFSKKKNRCRVPPPAPVHAFTVTSKRDGNTYWRFRWRLEGFGVAGAGAAACGWADTLAAGLLSHWDAQQLVFVVVAGLVDSLIIVE